MPEFKTLKELEDFIKNAIKNSLSEEVFTVVQKTEQKNIQEKVYNAYRPKVYPNIEAGINRRGYDGGLIADKNIVKTMVSDDTLQVTNETPPNPYARDQEQVSVNKSLADLIEFGEGGSDGNSHYDFIGEDESAAYLGARPFTQSTINELATTGKHKKALKDGLLRQGIKSE